MSAHKRIILGITDLKSLFQSIKTNYNYDFSNYALSSFKRRVEDFLFNYHLHNFDELIHKIENDADFYQLFLNAHSIETTEMFRDPEFWADLKALLLKRFRNNQDLKVWIPECNSGEELFTFLILIRQIDLIEKTSICVSTFNNSNIEQIRKASQDLKKMEINKANFERFEEGGDLSEHFIAKVNVWQIIPDYFVNVEIVGHNLFEDKCPGIYDLILFRNKMLYYNPQLKIEALRKLDSALKPGGLIAVGIKETFDYPSWERDYTIVSETEKIYKKMAN